MAKVGPSKARRDGSGLRKLVRMFPMTMRRESGSRARCDRMVHAVRVVDHSMFGSASGAGP